ncbi:chorismate synthase [Chelativorans sp. J32]|uniref:chorismate synthase n=1 Tax=Chelativorans sp. J32 TaxID=935840 RepID=UPI0004828DA4|nr:chorismate synthase [Chelativorans sp. J32]
MSHNTFGHLFRVTTWGESHGPAIGCIIDGCPPGIHFTRAEIQADLDRRRPGQSRFVTQRREPDEVKILSGVMEKGDSLVTTGTPISMLIENLDQRSKDYGEIAERYRPGHADYTYDVKYGLRDYRGGGRSSARETAARVAAGALARKVVPGMVVRAALISMGEKDIDRANWNWDFVHDPDNPFFTPDPQSVPVFSDYLDGIRKAGSSVGAVVEVVAEGVPAGLGAPVYGKLDQDICANLMSINAVKGVEIGIGFEAARIRGEENADEMRAGNDGRPRFLSNNAGGILGGISTGQPIIARFAVKPTSSILTPRRSVDRQGAEVEIVTKGRHDPCVGIRAVPIGEAMVACAIADHYLRHRGQTGQG